MRDDKRRQEAPSADSLRHRLCAAIFSAWRARLAERLGPEDSGERQPRAGAKVRAGAVDLVRAPCPQLEARLAR
jgi:hypothetical protein